MTRRVTKRGAEQNVKPGGTKEKHQPGDDEVFHVTSRVLKEAALNVIRTLDLLKRRVYFETPISLPDEVQKFEIRIIRAALIQTGGNQIRAAALLGLPNTTLNSKMRRYGISFDEEMGK